MSDDKKPVHREGTNDVKSDSALSDDLDKALRKGRQMNPTDFLKYSATKDVANAPILTNEPYPIDACLVDHLCNEFKECCMEVPFKMLQSLMLNRRVDLMGFKREAVNEAIHAWVAIQKGSKTDVPKINSLLERE